MRADDYFPNSVGNIDSLLKKKEEDVTIRSAKYKYKYEKDYYYDKRKAR